MPAVSVRGVRLEYDVAGSGGTTIIFLHEFGCTKDEWTAQVEFFASRRRVITPNAVGYPPSDVPDEPSAYAIDRQVENVLSILQQVGASKAHVVGHSMGGHVALEFGLRHPEATASLILVGAGSGQTNKEGFRKQCLKKAEELEELGLAGLGDYSQAPTRKRFEMKDPAAHRAYFVDAPNAKHSVKGRANTLRGFQATRPVWYDQEDELRQLQVPTLVVVGDEDEPCIGPGLFLKKTLPRCGLAVLPQTGHTIQVEEPLRFNALLQEFLAELEADPVVPGRWVPLEGCVNDAFSAAMAASSEPAVKKQRTVQAHAAATQHEARAREFAALPQPPSVASAIFPFLSPVAERLNYPPDVLTTHVEQVLQRIESVDKADVRALLPELDRGRRVLQEVNALAAKDDAKLRMRGALVAVKDIISVDGLDTRGGSMIPADALAMPECPAVTRLREAGAIIIGKATTTEFAMSDPTATANPHDTRRTPGGSSSGSAAAVAAGFCHLALGTQTGGSTIRPASYCGIFGYKATHGRIPTSPGLLQLSPKLDHLTIFGCDVKVVHAAAGVMLDCWNSKTWQESRRYPRIAVPDGPLLSNLAPEILQCFEATLDALKKRSITVQRVAAFAELDSVIDAPKKLLAHDVSKERGSLFQQFGSLHRPTLAMQIIQGRSITEAEALQASEAQPKLAKELQDQLVASGCDVWATPAATCEAPLGFTNTGSSAMQVPWTFAGMPCLTLPVGVGPAGMPLGFQLVAPFGADEQLLAWSEQISDTLSENCQTA